MTALPTSYIVNNGNYNNQDLNTIFAPITSAYDYGTWENYINDGFPTTTNYYNFSIQSEASGRDNFIGSNSFTQTSTNGVVTVGIESGSSYTASYIQFNEPGVYNVTFSFYTAQQGINPSSSGTSIINYYLRFNDTSQTAQTAVPTLNQNNFQSLSANGNAYLLNNNNNLIEIYGPGTTTNGAYNPGYPYYNISVSVDSSGNVYYNLYSISVTLKLISSNFINNEPFRLFPQLRSGSTGSKELTWGFRYKGNWMVTKLDKGIVPYVGSLLGNGNSYATGDTSKNLAGLNQPFTIEFFVYFNQVGPTQYLFAMGEFTNSQLIIYLESNEKIKLYGLGVDGSISTTTNIIANDWYHVAFTRDSNDVYNIYLNGSNQGNPTTIQTISADFQTVYVATYAVSTASSSLIGNMTNLRLTQKVVYTGNFTVPSVPLQTTQLAGTNISSINNTECVFLLQCYNNSLLKDSVTNNVLTNKGLTFSDASPP